MKLGVGLLLLIGITIFAIIAQIAAQKLSKSTKPIDWTITKRFFFLSLIAIICIYHKELM